MKSERHYLTPLFAPQSIAIIGASEREGSIGATLARNMLDMDYRGKLFFVNPKHKTLFGRPCFASIEDIGEALDLAAICTPGKTIPAIIDTCSHARTRSALIISFDTDLALPRHTLSIARRRHLRLLGPDSLGLMRPGSGINLTCTHNTATAGSIGLISQSGALCTAVLDWAQANNIGFSSVISLDNSCDVDFGETLDYLVADPQTKSIFLYIEGIRDARRFMSALRSAARCKPVLLLKVGRHPTGEQAARARCDGRVGADDIFDAALRRAGVVRLFTIGQMYATAQALFAHFLPRGNRLAIITNGGGPGVMAADQAEDIGIPLAEPDSRSLGLFGKILPAGRPANRHVSNPFDLGGDAGPDRYVAALQACQADRNTDGILAILTPQALTDPTQTARAMIKQAHQSDKPLVTCWMGETQVSEARRLFKGAGIPTFRTPEPAVELFSHLSRYFHNQKMLLQVPGAAATASIAGDDASSRRENARAIIETSLKAGRNILSGQETQNLLSAFGIPVEPVPLKTDDEEIRIDVIQDRVFGPAITLRPGKNHAFTSTKRAVALPPLNSFLIDDLLQRSHLTPLHDRNGSPTSTTNSLRILLLRVSEMVCELPWISEMELAPLIGDSHGAVTDHARIVIAERPTGTRRYDHMAIHPYPAHLVSRIQSKDGQTVTLRPIRPEDAAIEQEFIQGLSAESRYFRFMNAVHELPPAQLARLTQIDYDREMALIATLESPGNAEANRPEQEIGVARYATNPDGESCEFAIVVADSWQGTGLANHLMNALINAARMHGRLKFMIGDVLSNNQRMIDFVSGLGFAIQSHPEDTGLKRCVLELQ